MKKALISLFVLPAILFAGMASATANQDFAISSVVSSSDSVEAGATAQYTVEFVLDSSLPEESIINFLFMDPTGTYDYASTGFDVSEAVFASTTINESSFAAHQSTNAVGVITLTEFLDVGTYSFTLDGVINTSVAGAYQVSLSSDTNLSPSMGVASAEELTIVDAITSSPYQEDDVTDGDVYSAAVSSVAGLVDGQIEVVYNHPDNEGETIEVQYDVFSQDSSTKSVKVKQAAASYYIAQSGNGRKIALINVLSGEILSTKNIAGKNHTSKFLAVKTIRNKKWVVNVVKNKKGVNRIVLVKINFNNEQLTSKKVIVINSKKVKVSKTKIVKNKIIIKNKNKKVLEKLTLTKKLNFKGITN